MMDFAVLELRAPSKRAFGCVYVAKDRDVKATSETRGNASGTSHFIEVQLPLGSSVAFLSAADSSSRA